MSIWISASRVAEHEFRERAGEEGFADAGRPQKDERPDRPLRIFQIGARPSQRLADGGDGFVLADDALLQFGFHREQLLRFLLLHSLERNAGHFRDDVHHVVRGHEHFLLFPFLAPAGQNAVELLLRLLFLVAERGGFLEILGLDRGFLLDANLFDLLFDLLHVRRPRHRVDPRARAGFVHDIDRLVRQKAAGDVTLGKFHRGLERFVGQLGLVMRFVFRAQSFENQDRLFDRRRIDFHRLETAFQGGVLLNVFAILVQRRGADALQLAAAQAPA